MLERGRSPVDEKRSISFLERFKYAASISALYADSESLPQEDGFPSIVSDRRNASTDVLEESRGNFPYSTQGFDNNGLEGELSGQLLIYFHLFGFRLVGNSWPLVSTDGFVGIC